MPERTKEMIEKSLRLALFVSAQRLHETNKLTKSALQLLSHGDMVTKTSETDKRLCSGSSYAATAYFAAAVAEPAEVVSLCLSYSHAHRPVPYGEQGSELSCNSSRLSVWLDDASYES